MRDKYITLRVVRTAALVLGASVVGFGLGVAVKPTVYAQRANSAIYASADELGRLVASQTPQRLFEARPRPTFPAEMVLVRHVNADDPIAKQAAAHPTMDEVFFIIGGAATLETGGDLVDPKPDVIGYVTYGKEVRGGESRRVAKGDVVIIPAMVPHRFVAIEQPVSYVNVRFDLDVK
jgi:mannose-6-phosphate isomerase-like protein (cupin superfamily)